MNLSEIYDFVEEDGVDGFFIFYTALLNGMDIQRMPGQLFLISNHRTPNAKTSFVHSVAQSTRLSTTTFVLQKRFRRVLFQQAKVSMPPAATFSFYSKKDPIKYANKIGYPVVVKEMFGENPAYGIYNVNNKVSLHAAIDGVRRHLPVSSERTPSSYAQTINLGSAEVLDENTRVKSNKSRFIIEKQLSGSAYRVYVIGGKACFVIKSSDESFTTVESPSSSLVDLAEAAINAVPGIINAAVDIIQTDNGKCYLVEFSERLLPLKKVLDSEEFDVMSKIYSSLLKSEASLFGSRLSSLRNSAKYRVTFGGVSNLDIFNHSIENELIEAKLSSRMIRKDDLVGRVDLEIKGCALKLSMFLEKISNAFNVSYVLVKRKRLSI